MDAQTENKQMSEKETAQKKHPGRRFMIVFLVIVLVILPVTNGIGYEMVFRFMFLDTMRDIEKNEAEEKAFLSENSLTRSDIAIEGTKGKLQAYLYMKNGNGQLSEESRLIVLSHGIGNGHFAYLSLIGELMKLPDTAVFSYDATGNGQSDGKATGGLPQGIKDLDTVLDYIESNQALSKLQIMLLGHSWGAYSAGSVLEFHPEIKKAVLIAGFNASENMLQTYSAKYAGPVVYLFLPYVELYEMIKFGRYGNASIVRGCLESGTDVTIVQALDDSTVDPQKFGIKYLEKELADDEDVTFIELQEGGHTLPVSTVLDVMRKVLEQSGQPEASELLRGRYG